MIERARIPGAEPTLVFLHEGLGSLGLWRDFPQAVAERTGHGAMVYSRYGNGFSDVLGEKRGVRYMHDEALKTLPGILLEESVADPILIGHSDGASIALIHAGSAPGPRVRGVALEAPHVFCEDISVASIAAARDAYLDEESGLRARLARYHDDVDGAFWGWNRAWLDPGFRAWNLEAYLPRIDVPVLVVQGEDDAYGTLAQVDSIARGVRGPFSRRILAKCGHAPHKDQPEATLAAMTAFVREALAK